MSVHNSGRRASTSGVGVEKKSRAAINTMNSDISEKFSFVGSNRSLHSFDTPSRGFVSCINSILPGIDTTLPPEIELDRRLRLGHIPVNGSSHIQNFTNRSGPGENVSDRNQHTVEPKVGKASIPNLNPISSNVTLSSLDLPLQPLPSILTPHLKANDSSYTVNQNKNVGHIFSSNSTCGINSLDKLPIPPSTPVLSSTSCELDEKMKQNVVALDHNNINDHSDNNAISSNTSSNPTPQNVVSSKHLVKEQHNSNNKKSNFPVDPPSFRELIVGRPYNAPPTASASISPRSVALHEAPESSRTIREGRELPPSKWSPPATLLTCAVDLLRRHGVLCDGGDGLVERLFSSNPDAEDVRCFILESTPLELPLPWLALEFAHSGSDVRNTVFAHSGFEFTSWHHPERIFMAKLIVSIIAPLEKEIVLLKRFRSWSEQVDPLCVELQRQHLGFGKDVIDATVRKIREALSAEVVQTLQSDRVKSEFGVWRLITSLNSHQSVKAGNNGDSGAAGDHTLNLRDVMSRMPSMHRAVEIPKIDFSSHAIVSVTNKNLLQELQSAVPCFSSSELLKENVINKDLFVRSDDPLISTQSSLKWRLSMLSALWSFLVPSDSFGSVFPSQQSYSDQMARDGAKVVESRLNDSLRLLSRSRSTFPDEVLDHDPTLNGCLTFSPPRQNNLQSKFYNSPISSRKAESMKMTSIKVGNCIICNNIGCNECMISSSRAREQVKNLISTASFSNINDTKKLEESIHSDHNSSTVSTHRVGNEDENYKSGHIEVIDAILLSQALPVANINPFSEDPSAPDLEIISAVLLTPSESTCSKHNEIILGNDNASAFKLNEVNDDVENHAAIRVVESAVTGVFIDNDLDIYGSDGMQYIDQNASIFPGASDVISAINIKTVEGDLGAFETQSVPQINTNLLSPRIARSQVVSPRSAPHASARSVEGDGGNGSFILHQNLKNQASPRSLLEDENLSSNNILAASLSSQCHPQWKSQPITQHEVRTINQKNANEEENNKRPSPSRLKAIATCDCHANVLEKISKPNSPPSSPSKNPPQSYSSIVPRCRLKNCDSPDHLAKETAYYENMGITFVPLKLTASHTKHSHHFVPNNCPGWNSLPADDASCELYSSDITEAPLSLLPLSSPVLQTMKSGNGGGALKFRSISSSRKSIAMGDVSLENGVESRFDSQVLIFPNKTGNVAGHGWKIKENNAIASTTLNTTPKIHSTSISSSLNQQQHHASLSSEWGGALRRDMSLKSFGSYPHGSKRTPKVYYKRNSTDAKDDNEHTDGKFSPTNELRTEKQQQHETNYENELSVVADMAQVLAGNKLSAPPPVKIVVAPRRQSIASNFTSMQGSSIVAAEHSNEIRYRNRRVAAVISQQSNVHEVPSPCSTLEVNPAMKTSGFTFKFGGDEERSIKGSNVHCGRVPVENFKNSSPSKEHLSAESPSIMVNALDKNNTTSSVVAHQQTAENLMQNIIGKAVFEGVSQVEPSIIIDQHVYAAQSADFAEDVKIPNFGNNNNKKTAGIEDDDDIYYNNQQQEQEHYFIKQGRRSSWQSSVAMSQRPVNAEHFPNNQLEEEYGNQHQLFAPPVKTSLDNSLIYEAPAIEDEALQSVSRPISQVGSNRVRCVPVVFANSNGSDNNNNTEYKAGNDSMARMFELGIDDTKNEDSNQSFNINETTNLSNIYNQKNTLAIDNYGSSEVGTFVTGTKILHVVDEKEIEGFHVVKIIDDTLQNAVNNVYPQILHSSDA